MGELYPKGKRKIIHFQSHPRGMIVISAPQILPNEGERVTRLFEEGLDVFHLRKPGIPVNGMKAILGDIPVKYHKRIAFHQHHEWVLEQGFSRLHFPEYLRLSQSEKALQGYIGKNVVLSTSVHCRESAEKLSPTYTYAFLGPVFPSISKPGYRPTGNLLEQDLQGIQTPMVALGGVCEETIPMLTNRGFSGVALLGTIWSFSPERGLRNFLKCREALKRQA
jgi:thiamine-phosphate pyrophosphorylase